MLTRIVCPHCGHVGATAALLPRVLTCSRCRHDGLIRSGRPARSPTIMREDQVAERSASRRARQRETNGGLAPEGNLQSTARELDRTAKPHSVDNAE